MGLREKGVKDASRPLAIYYRREAWGRGGFEDGNQESSLACLSEVSVRHLNGDDSGKSALAAGRGLRAERLDETSLPRE